MQKLAITNITKAIANNAKAITTTTKPFDTIEIYCYCKSFDIEIATAAKTIVTITKAIATLAKAKCF